jgi:hypothetical protein
MARYSYVNLPDIGLTASRIFPSSPASSMPVPAAAAGVASAGAKGLGSAVFAELLANAIAGLVGKAGDVASQAAGAPGALAPMPVVSGDKSKYMLTLEDERAIRQYVDQENYRRGLLNMIPGGQDLPPLNADDIIQNRESQLRVSASQAGERERALENIRQQGAIQSQLAGQLGPSVSSANKVLEQAISQVLGRPGAEVQGTLTEIGRAV